MSQSREFRSQESDFEAARLALSIFGFGNGAIFIAPGVRCVEIRLHVARISSYRSQRCHGLLINVYRKPHGDFIHDAADPMHGRRCHFGERRERRDTIFRYARVRTYVYARGTSLRHIKRWNSTPATARERSGEKSRRFAIVRSRCLLVHHFLDYPGNAANLEIDLPIVR